MCESFTCTEGTGIFLKQPASSKPLLASSNLMICYFICCHTEFILVFSKEWHQVERETFPELLCGHPALAFCTAHWPIYLHFDRALGHLDLLEKSSWGWCDLVQEDLQNSHFICQQGLRQSLRISPKKGRKPKVWWGVVRYGIWPRYANSYCPM